MSSIDETTVDVQAVMKKIQDVKNGLLPEDAISTEELRAALAKQRASYGNEAVEGATKAAKKASSKKAAGNLSFDFSNLLGPQE